MELQHELASSTSGERSTNAAVSDLERHFTVAELSKRWFFSKNTIRRLFSQEPGVVRVARPQTRSKRGYTSMRIPERIAERVHRRLKKEFLDSLSDAAQDIGEISEEEIQRTIRSYRAERRQPEITVAAEV